MSIATCYRPSLTVAVFDSPSLSVTTSQDIFFIGVSSCVLDNPQLWKRKERKKIKTFQALTEFKLVTFQYRCSALTNWSMKPQLEEQVILSAFLWSGSIVQTKFVPRCKQCLNATVIQNVLAVKMLRKIRFYTSRFKVCKSGFWILVDK